LYQLPYHHGKLLGDSYLVSSFASACCDSLLESDFVVFAAAAFTIAFFASSAS